MAARDIIYEIIANAVLNNPDQRMDPTVMSALKKAISNPQQVPLPPIQPQQGGLAPDEMKYWEGRSDVGSETPPPDNAKADASSLVSRILGMSPRERVVEQARVADRIQQITNSIEQAGTPTTNAGILSLMSAKQQLSALTAYRTALKDTIGDITHIEDTEAREASLGAARQGSATAAEGNQIRRARLEFDIGKYFEQHELDLKRFNALTDYRATQLEQGERRTTTGEFNAKRGEAYQESELMQGGLDAIQRAGQAYANGQRELGQHILDSYLKQDKDFVTAMILHLIPPGAEYVPSWEPDSPRAELHRRLRIPYTPRRADDPRYSFPYNPTDVGSAGQSLMAMLAASSPGSPGSPNYAGNYAMAPVANYQAGLPNYQPSSLYGPPGRYGPPEEENDNE